MSEPDRLTETEITETDIGDLDMPIFRKEDGTPDESIVPLPAVWSEREGMPQRFKWFDYMKGG